MFKKFNRLTTMFFILLILIMLVFYASKKGRDYRHTVKELNAARDSLSSAIDDIRSARLKIDSVLTALGEAEQQLSVIKQDAEKIDRNSQASRIQAGVRIDQLKTDLINEQNHLKDLQENLNKLK
jgi:hypothetical protein